jgi:hypothetical protein
MVCAQSEIVGDELYLDPSCGFPVVIWDDSRPGEWDMSSFWGLPNLRKIENNPIHVEPNDSRRIQNSRIPL